MTYYSEELLAHEKRLAEELAARAQIEERNRAARAEQQKIRQEKRAARLERERRAAEEKQRELVEKRRREEEQDRVRRATLEKLNRRPSLPPMNPKAKTPKADMRTRKQGASTMAHNTVEDAKREDEEEVSRKSVRSTSGTTEGYPCEDVDE